MYIEISKSDYGGSIYIHSDDGLNYLRIPANKVCEFYEFAELSGEDIDHLLDGLSIIIRGYLHEYIHLST